MSTTEERSARLEEGDSPLATGIHDKGLGVEFRAELHGLRNDIRALEKSLKVWLVAAAIVQGVFNPLIMHAIWSGS